MYSITVVFKVLPAQPIMRFIKIVTFGGFAVFFATASFNLIVVHGLDKMDSTEDLLVKLVGALCGGLSIAFFAKVLKLSR